MYCFYRYVLVAVVHHQNFHYTTYIRRGGETNYWEIHNDMASKIESVNNCDVIKVELHALFYVLSTIL